MSDSFVTVLALDSHGYSPQSVSFWGIYVYYYLIEDSKWGCLWLSGFENFGEVDQVYDYNVKYSICVVELFLCLFVCISVQILSLDEISSYMNGWMRLVPIILVGK